MTSGPVMGDCRLCPAVGVPLMDSHIIPKWAYRRARDPSRANGAPDPVQIEEGAAIQTSTQIKEYMLCNDCEQRMGRDEDYVSRLAYQEDGTLGLTQNLPKGSMFRAGGPYARGVSLSHLDCSAIARFAASVFWRAHVAEKQKISSLKLWKPQVEALRRYVLRERPLPYQMCLTVFALVDGEELTSVHSGTLTTPATAKRGDNSLHQFVVAGLLFNLTTGTQSTPRLCLACGPSPHATIQHWKAVGFVRAFSDAIQSAERKGRLAKLSV